MNSVSKQNTSHVLITIASFVIIIAGLMAASEIIVPFLLAVFIAIILAPPLFGMPE